MNVYGVCHCIDIAIYYIMYSCYYFYKHAIKSQQRHVNMKTLLRNTWNYMKILILDLNVYVLQCCIFKSRSKILNNVKFEKTLFFQMLYYAYATAIFISVPCIFAKIALLLKWMPYTTLPWQTFYAHFINKCLRLAATSYISL